MQAEGVCGFVDDIIILLARRFGADPEAHSGAWQQVSDSLFRQISRPATDEERRYFLHVDPALFTPAICRLRAQYVLWKAKKAKAQQTRQAGGGFDITKNSIGDVVASLYEGAKLALPSSLGNGDSDNDAEDGVAVQVLNFRMKSQEEMEKDAALARAEDDLLTKVAQLQHEHFLRHRRWVDVPESMLSKPSQTTLQAIATARMADEAAAASTTSIDNKELADFTVADVRTLLRKLKLEAFEGNFLRTDGALLLQLSKADIRHRTNPDFEAADVLWSWMQAHNSANRRGNGVAIMAALGALRTPSSDLQTSSSRLSSFERGIAPNGNDNKTGHVDPFVDIKRAINPSRPQRPSATRYEDDDEEAAEMLRAYRQDLGDDLPNSIPIRKAGAAVSKSVSQSVSNQASPAASPPKASTAASAPRQESSSSRAGRWNIVEYDDDDDDDEEE